MTNVYVHPRFRALMDPNTTSNFEFDGCAVEGLTPLPDENEAYSLKLHLAPDHRADHPRHPQGVGFLVDPSSIFTIGELNSAIEDGFDPKLYRDNHGNNLLVQSLLNPVLCERLIDIGLSIRAKNHQDQSPLGLLTEALVNSRGETNYFRLRETLNVFARHLYPGELAQVLSEIGEAVVPA